MDKERKTSNILNVVQYDASGNVVLPGNLTANVGGFTAPSGTTQSIITQFNNSTNSAYVTVSGVGSSSSITTWINGSMSIEAVPYSSGNLNISSYTGNIILQTNGRTTALTIDSSQIATFVSTVNANSFSGAGTGLTGTAASLTAGNATKWTTGRTISITGDLTYTSGTLDGSGNVTGSGTLATVNSNTGSFGSATSVSVFTVNGKGLITAASTTSIQIAESQVTNLTSDLSGKLSTTTAASTYLTISTAASSYQPLENQRLSTGNSPSFVSGTFSSNVIFGNSTATGIQNSAGTAWIRPQDSSGNTHIYNNGGGSIYLDAPNIYIRTAAGANTMTFSNGAINVPSTITGTTFYGAGTGLTGTAGMNVTGYSSQLGAGDGTSLAGSISVTRVARTSMFNPNAYTNVVAWDFKTAAAIATGGTTGNYGGLLTLAPWVSTTSSTGDPTYQLSFQSNGANVLSLPHLHFRAGIDTTWGSWYEILHSGNYSSFITSGVSSIVAGTNISISGSTGSVTITNGITNNNQLTNGNGYITASSSNTLTNKGGNISMWTNDSGYITNSTSSLSNYYTSTTSDSRYLMSITSGMITTALGYTPYNSSNPSGYITNSTSSLSNYYTAGTSDGRYAYVAGSNASGTWGINVTGTAGSTQIWYSQSHPTSYYLVNNWDGTYWHITSNHPNGARVGYADVSGSANSVAWSNVSSRPSNVSYWTNDSGYITGISSGMVTSALGYTPYNSSNPSGYISSYTETSTLSAVTGRGSSTSTYVSLNGGATIYYIGGSSVPGSSYGSIRIDATAGGYGGIYLYSCSGTIIGMTDTSGSGGDWDPTTGWHYYWYRTNQCLGIGGSTTSSSYRAYTNGSHYIAGDLYASGNVTSYSDITKKTNIRTVENALDKVLLLRGVNYEMIDNIGVTNIGVIAQEINQIVPEVVVYTDNQYGVNYGNLAGLFIEAIKGQNKQVVNHEERIIELEKELSKLKKLVN